MSETRTVISMPTTAGSVPKDLGPTRPGDLGVGRTMVVTHELNSGSAWIDGGLTGPSQAGQLSGEGFGVPCADMATCSDEEGWGTTGSAGFCAGRVFANGFREPAALQVTSELLGVETQMSSVSDKVFQLEFILMLKEEIVHFPEAALGVDCLSRLRGQFGMRVHVGQGQVSEDVPQVITEPFAQFPDDAGRLATEWTLEISVLDES